MKTLTKSPTGEILALDTRYPDIIAVTIGFRGEVDQSHWPNLQRTLQKRYRANFPRKIALKLQKQEADRFLKTHEFTEIWFFLGLRNPTKALKNGHELIIRDKFVPI